MKKALEKKAKALGTKAKAAEKKGMTREDFCRFTDADFAAYVEAKGMKGTYAKEVVNVLARFRELCRKAKGGRSLVADEETMARIGAAPSRRKRYANLVADFCRLAAQRRTVESEAGSPVRQVVVCIGRKKGAKAAGPAKAQTRDRSRILSDIVAVLGLVDALFKELADTCRS